MFSTQESDNTCMCWLRRANRMWVCQHCGEEHEEQFDTCWKCSSQREPVSPTAQDENLTSETPSSRRTAGRKVTRLHQKHQSARSQRIPGISATVLRWLCGADIFLGFIYGIVLAGNPGRDTIEVYNALMIILGGSILVAFFFVIASISDNIRAMRLDAKN